ncbi:unnamed protein product [Symbiodinium necroappetens]|uniref:Uncharacterized protein n=1 Tax=Symbiodinium necroappetens TaxID=1628268 RepID=A0A812IUP1_9DINO|nr:unnamed protein product [Symbiodinium necroappetens]
MQLQVPPSSAFTRLCGTKRWISSRAMKRWGTAPPFMESGQKRWNCIPVLPSTSSTKAKTRNPEARSPKP